MNFQRSLCQLSRRALCRCCVYDRSRRRRKVACQNKKKNTFLIDSKDLSTDLEDFRFGVSIPKIWNQAMLDASMWIFAVYIVKDTTQWMKAMMKRLFRIKRLDIFPFVDRFVWSRSKGKEKKDRRTRSSSRFFYWWPIGRFDIDRITVKVNAIVTESYFLPFLQWLQLTHGSHAPISQKRCHMSLTCFRHLSSSLKKK